MSTGDHLRRSLRLAELRRKYGTEGEALPMPAWLDTLEGAMAERQAAAGDPFSAQSLVKPKPEPRIRVPLSALRNGARPHSATEAIIDI